MGKYDDPYNKDPYGKDPSTRPDGKVKPDPYDTAPPEPPPPPNVDPRNQPWTGDNAAPNVFARGGLGRGLEGGVMPGYSPRAFENLLARRHLLKPNSPELMQLITWANNYWGQPQFAGWSGQQRHNYASSKFGTRWDIDPMGRSVDGSDSTFRNPPSVNQWGQWKGPNDRFMPGTGPAFGMTPPAPQQGGSPQPAAQTQGLQGQGMQAGNRWAQGMLPMSRGPVPPGGASAMANAAPVKPGTGWNGGTQYNVYGGQVGPTS